MTNRAPTGRPRGTRNYSFNADVAIKTRVRRGLTQVQLSDRCLQVGGLRVNDSNIAKYERGGSCPSPPTIKALAAALSLDVDDLITFVAAPAAAPAQAPPVSTAA
ncbi:MAG TPA: helix-turn-helix transcriptional regulator [Streptosporangiaceae bacterium]|nr:helix-turn-helix transcriptional regulator [Streptosporangiaceae bacterium]